MTDAPAPKPIDLLPVEVQNRIRAAEARHGVRYGARLDMDGQVFIDVTFYPSTKWWLVKNGERVPLTENLWRATWPLKL